MHKVFIIASLSLIAINHLTAQTDEMVEVHGTVYRAKDSTSTTGNILYEKLPYYDDMGMVSTKEDGSFTALVVKGENYNFSIAKPGHKKVEIQDQFLSDGQIDFYIEEEYSMLVKLDDLIFGNNTDHIDPSSYQELDDLAKWMNENHAVVIQLEGHTDFGGNAEASLKLSQARVDAVKAYLVQKKVPKRRIFTKAFGGTHPLSHERTPEARAMNRRVEVRVIRS